MTLSQHGLAFLTCLVITSCVQSRPLSSGALRSTATHQSLLDGPATLAADSTPMPSSETCPEHPIYFNCNLGSLCQHYVDGTTANATDNHNTTTPGHHTPASAGDTAGNSSEAVSMEVSFCGVCNAICTDIWSGVYGEFQDTFCVEDTKDPDRQGYWYISVHGYGTAVCEPRNPSQARRGLRKPRPPKRKKKGLRKLL